MNSHFCLTLPLQCYNAKCLYNDKQCKTIEFKVKENKSDFNLQCDLPLEFSFEATSSEFIPVLDSPFKFISNQSVIPSGTSGMVMTSKNKKSHRNDTDYFDIQRIQFKNAYNYHSSGSITYPPCLGSEPQDYDFCYGSNGKKPCQFIGVVDMEDFM